MTIDWRRHLSVGVHGQHAALNTHLQRPDLEVQVHILRHHAGGQRQARAFPGVGVVVLNGHCDGLSAHLGQGQAQAQLHIEAQRQRHATFARGVQERAKAGRQIDARERGQVAQLQVQAKLVAVVQRQLDVEEQLAGGHVDADVEQFWRQGQGLLDRQFSCVKTTHRIVHEGLQIAQPAVPQHHQLRQRAVDDGQLRRVERLLSRQLVDGFQAKTHCINQISETQIAHIEQAAQVGQDHHHGARREAAVLDRRGQVERCCADLDLAPVQQVLHVQTQLQVCTKRHAGAPGLHRQTLQAGRGVARQIHHKAVQHIAGEQFRDVKARTAGRVGRAVQTNGGLRVQVHPRTRSCTARLQPQEAQLRGHREVGHREFNSGTGR